MTVFECFWSSVERKAAAISLLPTLSSDQQAFKMSGKGAREAVFPTRMTLNTTKTRLKGAQTGHSLLKRKADALTKRFRDITGKIDEAKRKMGKVMQVASFSIAEVNYATGDIAYTVQESVKNASFTVQAKQENVSGVLLPAFESVPPEKGGAGGEFGFVRSGKRWKKDPQRKSERGELGILATGVDQLESRPGRSVRFLSSGEASR